MESTEGYTMRLTAHARQQMEAKKFDKEIVEYTFVNPAKVYPNRKFAGQFRVTGNGICLVGEPMRDGTFLVFTMYEDGVMTPPREDQKDTPEGQEYVALYNKALESGRVKRTNEYWPRIHERNDSEMGHTLIR